MLHCLEHFFDVPAVDELYSPCSCLLEGEVFIVMDFPDPHDVEAKNDVLSTHPLCPSRAFLVLVSVGEF